MEGTEMELENENDELHFFTAEGHHGTLNIFPVEIWEEILEHVEDSKDLQNFCKAFNFWENALHRTKQAWLFDQVFQHIWPHLSTSEILGCRRVCKRWCAAVDRFLENNEYHRPAGETTSHIRRRPVISELCQTGLLYSPYSLMRMEKMCRCAVTHPRNSIIGRSVSVDWERIPFSYIPFLSKFGKYIWYLRVQCTQREIHPVPFVQRILQYLPHLPNLRKLELLLWEAPSTATGPFTTNDLDLHPSRHPVGYYPQLESLELDIMGQLHGQVKDILVNTFSQQIRRLSINRFALCCSLPNLTDLSITVDSNNYQLECLLQLKSPLTRLTLSLVDHANYPLAFKAIQRFAPTLRVMSLEFPTATSFSPLDWKQLKSPSFNLPILKTLTLKGCIPPSLNFICKLYSLENLHIYDRRSSELVALLDNQTLFEEECVQILRYLNQPSQFQKVGCMYQSNVWVIFPKLREFTFTSFIRRTPNVEWCYRRDHYDRTKQKMEANMLLKSNF